MFFLFIIFFFYQCYRKFRLRRRKGIDFDLFLASLHNLTYFCALLLMQLIQIERHDSDQAGI